MDHNSDAKAADKPSSQQPGDVPGDVRDFWTPSRVRMLVTTIVAMAVILVLGFGFIIYTVIERSLTAKELKAQEIKRISAPAPSMEIDMNGYKILNMSSDGAFITLQVEKAGKLELWLVNATTKKVKKVISLKP
jgi:hypothetical protein